MNIIVPKFGQEEGIPAWVERSMRQGNFLHKYLERERARTNHRMTQTAEAFKDYKRKPGSEFELISVMDGRTFQRWNQTDPGIIEDPKEFKKLIRDNPEMTPWRNN